MKVVVQDGPHVVPNAPSHSIVAGLPLDASLQEELDAMLEVLTGIHVEQPDVIMVTCMAFMARCTELHVQLVRVESREGRALKVRTMQLRPVMELIDFTFKAASRLIEVHRQDMELSR